MVIIIFIGGIVVGLLISILVIVLANRYNPHIQNAISTLQKSTSSKAYIVGLSESEQSELEAIKSAHSRGIDYKVK